MNTVQSILYGKRGMLLDKVTKLWIAAFYDYITTASTFFTNVLKCIILTNNIRKCVFVYIPESLNSMLINSDIMITYMQYISQILYPKALHFHILDNIVTQSATSPVPYD